MPRIRWEVDHVTFDKFRFAENAAVKGAGKEAAEREEDGAGVLSGGLSEFVRNRKDYITTDSISI